MRSSRPSLLCPNVRVGGVMETLCMRKVTPYLANGQPKICWGCGNPFVVRDGRAEAILAPDNRLYCYGTACADDAFASQVVAIERAA